MIFTLEFEEKKFLCPPKIIQPPSSSHTTLAPGLPIRGKGQVNKLRKSQQNVVYSKTIFRFVKAIRKMQRIDILCLDFC